MYTGPTEVLVKRSDLPPITDEGMYYLVDSIRYYKTNGVEVMREAALRFLAVATRMEDEAKKEAEKKAKDWELKHAVPLARTMYNSFHNFSSNYREDITEDLWIKYYEERHTSTMTWVATASAVLKEQEHANV